MLQCSKTFISVLLISPFIWWLYFVHASDGSPSIRTTTIRDDKTCFWDYYIRWVISPLLVEASCPQTSYLKAVGLEITSTLCTHCTLIVQLLYIHWRSACVQEGLDNERLYNFLQNYLLQKGNFSKSHFYLKSSVALVLMMASAHPCS